MTLYRILFPFLTIVALITSGCSDGDKAEAATRKATLPVSVGAHEVVTHTFRRQLEISADILAHKQVTLLSKVPGEVKRVFVAEGDKVKKGDLVVKLDQKDYRLALRQAKAQLAAAKAGVTAAEVGLDTVTAKHQRLAVLRDKQVITESAFEDIEGSQRSTKAQVSLAEAQLELAEVGLDSARANLSYTEIRAPFDGEVARRMVDEGARLNAMPPTPIVIIQDAKSLKIVGAVSERDLPFISAGTPVEVSVDALAGAPIAAAVDRVEPIVDPKSRTAGVQVVLENADGRLQPGMSARLLLNLGARESVAVPDDAILRSELEGDTGWVFVLRHGKAFRRKVRLGAREGHLREIVDGLKAGETIVRGGQEKVKDGERVTLDTTEEDKR
jgi:RND family efflux transporter MFP subunit